jgi:hypothetical protein
MESTHKPIVLFAIPDFYRFLAFSLAMCVLAHTGLGPSWPWISHLGAEYHCISDSLARGNGFSDPFTAATGPTAWMPPLLPVLMAGVTLVGGQVGLGLVFCLSHFAIISAALACVVQVARRTLPESTGYTIAFFSPWLNSIICSVSRMIRF